MTTMIVIIGEYDDKDDGDDGNNGDNDNDDDDDTYYTGKNVPACLVAYKEDSRYLVKKRFSYFIIRNCPVVMMEAMNDECQEAIIGAFTRMHPNEIYLTKEQASEYYMLHALMSGLASHFTPHHTIP